MIAILVLAVLVGSLDAAVAPRPPASLLPAADAAAVAPEVPPVLAATVDGEALQAATIDVLGLTLDDAMAKPSLAAGVLTLSGCTARAYGGTLTATIDLSLTSGSHRFRVEAHGLDLAAFLRSFAGIEDGTGGTVDLSMDLTVPATAPRSMKGHAELHLRHGTLLQMSTLANLLVGDYNNRAGADNLDAHLDIGDGRIRVTGASVYSDAALVKLHGTISLDGNLDLVVIPYPGFQGIKTILPFVGNVAAWLLGMVSSRIARGTIRGFISQPVLVLNPFAH